MASLSSSAFFSTPGILLLYGTLRSKVGLPCRDDYEVETNTPAAEPAALASSVVTDAARNKMKIILAISTFFSGVIDLCSPYASETEVLQFLAQFPKVLCMHQVADALAQLLSLSVPLASRQHGHEQLIWTAVSDLLSLSQEQQQDDTPPQTPDAPQSTDVVLQTHVHTPAKSQQGLRPPVDDTPARANSGLQFSNSSQTHAEVDPHLRNELQNAIYRDVHGFYTFFPAVTEREWNCATSCPAICLCEVTPGSIFNHPAASQLTPFPTLITEQTVLTWFDQLNQHLLSHTTMFHSSRNVPLQDSSASRKCDIFLTARHTAEPGTTPS